MIDVLFNLVQMFYFFETLLTQFQILSFLIVAMDYLVRVRETPYKVHILVAN